jgi:acyl-CoA synthetase
VGLHPAERVREYRDKGYWTDDMIDALLRKRVAQFGDITAITDPLNREALLDGPFRALTWPQLDEQVSRLAQVLLAEGAGPGDVIGVQLPNTVEIVVAFLAIVRIGAIVAPFPVQYRAWELTNLSNVAQVKLFITASRIGQRPAAAELAGLRPRIPSLQWVGRSGPGSTSGSRRPMTGPGWPRTWTASPPTRTTASRSAGPRGRRARRRACRGPTTTGWPCARARWKART